MVTHEATELTFTAYVDACPSSVTRLSATRRTLQAATPEQQTAVGAIRSATASAVVARPKDMPERVAVELPVSVDDAIATVQLSPGVRA